MIKIIDAKLGEENEHRVNTGSAPRSPRARSQKRRRANWARTTKIDQKQRSGSNGSDSIRTASCVRRGPVPGAAKTPEDASDRQAPIRSRVAGAAARDGRSKARARPV